MRWMHTWAAIALAAGIALASGFGRADEPAVISTIDTAEPVTATLLGDVDGDGLADAALLIDRRVVLHRQRADRSFPSTPDAQFTLPGDVIAVDLATWDPPRQTRALPRSQLLMAGARGVRVLDLAQQGATPEPIELPELPPLLTTKAGGARPVRLTMSADADGAAPAELLVPTEKGVAVLRRADSQWSLLGIARAKVEARVRFGEDRPGASLQHEFELPRVSVVEAKRPGEKPLKYVCVSQESEARVYRVAGDRLEEAQRVHALFRFDHEDRFRQVRGTRQNEEVNDRAVGLQPADLNGDGVLDFVTSRFRDGQVFIIRGKEGRFAAQQPDRTIDAEGWVVPVQPKDLDGDGLPELIVPRLPKIGIASALRALLSRKVSFDLWVFRGNDAPDAGPAWKRSLDVEIVLGGDEGKFNVSARLLMLFTDVDGDGLEDLVSRGENERLEVYRGVRGDLISDESVTSLGISKASEWPEVDLRGSDLDGDGRSDLILTFGANLRGARNRIQLAVWNPRPSSR